VLCSLLWVTLLRQGLGWGIPRGPFQPPPSRDSMKAKEKMAGRGLFFRKRTICKQGWVCGPRLGVLGCPQESPWAPQIPGLSLLGGSPQLLLPAAPRAAPRGGLRTGLGAEPPTRGKRGCVGATRLDRAAPPARPPASPAGLLAAGRGDVAVGVTRDGGSARLSLLSPQAFRLRGDELLPAAFPQII